MTTTSISPGKQISCPISISRILTASALMILTMGAASLLNHSRDVGVLKPLSTFPTNIGPWSGRIEHFDQKIYDVLGVDDSFLCDYTTSEGREIQLYIGFYQSQREGDLIHSPKNCMPGSGFNITSISTESLAAHNSNPETVNVVKLILEKGSQKQVVLYWFHSRGRVISSEYWQKIYLVWDAVFKHRTDGAFVRLIAPADTGESDTAQYMKRFAERLLPILQQYLPGV